MENDFCDFMKTTELIHGWEQIKLEDIAFLTTGNSAPQGKEFFEKGKFPFVRVYDMGRSRSNVYMMDTRDKINNLAANKMKLFPKGSVLFTKSGMSILLNQRAILGRDMYVVSHIGVAIPHEKIISEFLYYWLRTVDFRELTHATTLPSLQISKVKNLQMPLPPFNEQKRIVSKIEELFKENKTTRESLDKVSKIMKKFKQSMISDLLTKNDNVESIQLKNLLREPLRNGKSALPSMDDKGIPVLKLSAVTFKDFRASNVKICNIKKPDIDDLWVKKNDILIARSNTIEYVGMGVIYEGQNDQFIFPDLMIRVRVNENLIRPKFLAFFLDSSLARDHFRRNAGGTAGSMPKISQGDIENLHVLIPSIAEQDIIVKKIMESFSFVDQIEKSIESAKKRTDRIDQAILAKAFRGELVPQDPNDESASVLLEKIKSEREKSEQKLSKSSRKKMVKKLT